MKRKRVILRIQGVQGLRRHGLNEVEGQGREGRGDDVNISLFFFFLGAVMIEIPQKGVKWRFLGFCADIFSGCSGAPVMS